VRKNIFLLFVFLLYLVPTLCVGTSSVAAQELPSNKLFILTVDDQIINPIIADYLIQGIEKAEQEQAKAVIIQLDTPGGLMTSTHLIVRKILNAKIPVVVYITPKGARGGSAGVFITLASHIAAMAPSTHIGAAHPVEFGESPSPKKEEGIDPKEIAREITKELSPKDRKKKKAETSNQKPEIRQGDILSEKITNDAVAWVRSLAKNKGRNEEWAVKTVLESASLTEQEAESKGLVEFLATDLQDLIKQLEGRTIAISEVDQRVFQLNAAEKVWIELTTRQKVLSILANPNVAYLLMSLGGLGLFFEFAHPGLVFPAVGGSICLILAFVAFQTLPINYGGVLLVSLALVLFIAEAFTPTFGVLTLGGIVCMILGSMMLINSPFPVLQVSWTVFLPIAIATGAITFFLGGIAVRAHRRKAKGGREGLIGSIGIAETQLNPKGKVLIEGEIWDAVSETPIEDGKEVRVVRVEGLKLFVEEKK
jgi:membrane-bound serine protease (ClpP class)